MRHSGIEWEIIGIKSSNPDSFNYKAIGERFIYLEYKEDSVQKTFFKVLKNTEEKNKIWFDAKKGGRNKNEKTYLLPRGNYKFGTNTDLFTIPFLHTLLGERNGVYLRTNLLCLGQYKIQKVISNQSDSELYVILKDSITGNIMYMKSVKNVNRKIQLPDEIKEIQSDLTKIKKQGLFRPIKSLAYLGTALHSCALLPAELILSQIYFIPRKIIRESVHTYKKHKTKRKGIKA